MSARGIGALAMGAAALAAATPAAADVRLAGVFGDHMVLQRGLPIPVWGTAAPGEQVEVAMGQVRRRARAGADGHWSLRLPALAAGGPHDLRAGSSVLRDVLIGDVWLCAGQSNMEWTLAQSRDAASEIAAADAPSVRHVKIAHSARLLPQTDVDAAPWHPAQPAHVGDFSAVGWYFAQRLHTELGVPIGLVNNSWGGSHIETWTSARTALRDDDLAPLVRARPRDESAFVATLRERLAAIARAWQGALPLWEGRGAAPWSAPDVDDAHWPTLEAPRVWEQQGLAGFDGTVWYRKRVTLTAEQARGEATLELGMIDDCDETWVNGRPVGRTCGWDTPRRYRLPAGTLQAGENVVAVRVLDTGGAGGFHGRPETMQLRTADGTLALHGRWQARVESPLAKSGPDANDLPTLAFNGMAHPLTRLPVRGVIWYQGESNVPRAARYATAFERLIGDWRAHWRERAGVTDLPFLYVQLAAFLPLADNTLQGSRWAELRDAQRQALRVEGTGMVVATDVGDANDIHPRDKRPVGERLARVALRRVYGHAALEDSGPVFRTSRALPAGRIELRFDHAAGLAARGGGSAVRGFALAGADRRFVEAQARIENGRVIVWSDAVSEPQAVRYGWVDNPEQSNLVNADGLPASPFRTDRWPLLSQATRYGDAN